jgi:hypothetical protein
VLAPIFFNGTLTNKKPETSNKKSANNKPVVNKKVQKAIQLKVLEKKLASETSLIEKIRIQIITTKLKNKIN